MAFADQLPLLNDGTFTARVTLCLVKACLDVLAEPKNTVGHDPRCALAEQVLANPDGHTRRFALGVVTNLAVVANSTDGDIQFTVNAMFNAYAGVTL